MISNKKVYCIYAQGESIEKVINKLKERLKGDIPQLTIVFISSKFHREYEEIIRKLKMDVGGEIFGGSTAGEISPEGFKKDSIVCLSIIAPSTIFKAKVVHEFSENLKEMGKTAVKRAFEGLKIVFDLYDLYFRDMGTLKAIQSLPFHMLVMMSGLGGEEDILSGVAESSLNKIQAAGGSAGDDLKLEKTWVFSTEGVSCGGISLAAIYSLLKTGVGIKNGFKITEDPSKHGVVTENGDSFRIVKAINNRPAAEVYYEWIGLHKDFSSTKDFAINPVGVIEPSSKILKVRSPAKVLEDGSLMFYCDVPVGTGVSLLKVDRNSHVNALREALKEAYKRAGFPKDIGGIIIFNCILRTLLSEIFKTEQEEINIIKEIIGPDTPFIGFSTYGETGNSDLIPLWHHNQTVTVFLISKELIKE